MHRLAAAKWVMFLAVALVLAACGDKAGEGGVRKRPVPVTVAKVRMSAVPVQIRAVGNVEPCQSVAVRSQVGGIITEQHVKDGQEVASGDVLFVLDTRPFQATLKDARGKLERDTALLKRAEDDLLRYTDLVKKNVISQQQFDQSQTDAMSLRGSIKLSEAEIDQAKLQLEYAVIRAPFAGRVGSVLINQGNVIKANDDRDLLVINQIQPIFVTFSVPEQYLPAISAHMAKEKLAVSAQVAGAEDNPEEGYLASVDNAVDRATGTIKLKGLFENNDKRLWPGQFARCALNLSMARDVLTVPSQAIQQGLKGSFVYVAKADNSAEFRLVEIGDMIDGRTVITKGLDQGESVVTDGHVRLTPGAFMEIKEEGQAS